ncbi:hypothetical protein [Bradyrhizobium sp. HKCCYLRH1062]
MVSCAECERAPIRERQREGIAVAKRKGVYRGRRRVPDGVAKQAILSLRFV